MRAPRNLLVNNQVASIPASMPPRNPPEPTPRGPAAASAAAVSGGLSMLSALHVSDRSHASRFASSSSLHDDPRRHASTSGPPPPPSSSSGLTNLTAAYHHQQQQQQQSALTTTVTTEHYARNLVGAAVTSANVLRDERDQFCIFFVLQDLSVRAEGSYRIRLLFTDLAQR